MVAQSLTTALSDRVLRNWVSPFKLVPFLIPTNVSCVERILSDSNTFPNELTYISNIILPDHTYIGIGAPAPRGSKDDIRPLQTYEAEPNLKSQIFPKLTYFVCTGEYEAGVIVDRNTIGQAIKLEFTGAAIPEVNLYQNNSGNYVEDGTDRVLTTSPYTTSNGVTISVSDVRV